MPTECSPALFEFAPVENRRVVAGFDGGAITPRLMWSLRRTPAGRPAGIPAIAADPRHQAGSLRASATKMNSIGPSPHISRATRASGL